MKRIAIGVVLGVVGCGSTVGPAAAPAPRAITPVSSSFGRTWDAVIDVFGERNIPIKQMERVSGFIATDNIALSLEDQRMARAWAQCARGQPPTHAVYNVIVRGDSASSTVKVSVKWEWALGRQMQFTSCSTTRIWEVCAEDDIKARAERLPSQTCATTAQRRGRDENE